MCILQRSVTRWLGRKDVHRNYQLASSRWTGASILFFPNASSFFFVHAWHSCVCYWTTGFRTFWELVALNFSLSIWKLLFFLKKYIKQIERITMTNNLHFRLMNMKICRPRGCFLQKLDQLKTEGTMMGLVCLCHLHCPFREEEREQSIREPFQLWDTTHWSPSFSKLWLCIFFKDIISIKKHLK